MGRPMASYKREADKNTREAVQLSTQIKQGKIDKMLSGDGSYAKSKKEQAIEMFNALRVGDSMQCFGISASVAKKNAKSVVTELGTKWTMKELGI